jgi:hypothetical protein
MKRPTNNSHRPEKKKTAQKMHIVRFARLPWMALISPNCRGQPMRIDWFAFWKSAFQKIAFQMNLLGRLETADCQRPGANAKSCLEKLAKQSLPCYLLTALALEAER